MQNTIIQKQSSATPPVWSVPNVFAAIAAFLKPAHCAADVAARVAESSNPPGA